MFVFLVKGRGGGEVVFLRGKRGGKGEVELEWEAGKKFVLCDGVLAGEFEGGFGSDVGLSLLVSFSVDFVLGYICGFLWGLEGCVLGWCCGPFPSLIFGKSASRRRAERGPVEKEGLYWFSVFVSLIGRAGL